MDKASFRHLGQDLTASVVVFLVALPLCMGIAIASGAPPALGLLTGMVGGLVAGSLAGQPLQVSGPAAGLTVLVWDLIERYGLEALGVAVIACGVLQLAAGAVHLGRWFRAVSPAVIHGMLAGIGMLIVASQLHVMLDHSPKGSGIDNLLTLPTAIIEAFDGAGTVQHRAAALVGMVTIGVLVSWNRLHPKRLSAVPGALVAVVFAAALTHVAGVSIRLVDVPESLAQSLNLPSRESFGLLKDPSFLGQVVGLAVIASAESLLCATAVDRMQDGPRTKYDRELTAQGVGNTVCGIMGALPMTGVIVRSSANVQAGARSRASAILHGVWLVALVGLAPFVLELVPTATLSAILVYTGVRLIDITRIRELWTTRRDEAVVLVVTMATITTTDLLTGVIVGLALAMGKLVLNFSKLDVTTRPRDPDDGIDVWMGGAATFLSLPSLAEALEALPAGATVYLHVGDVVHFDHAALETLQTWERRFRDQGGEVHVDWRVVEERTRSVRPTLGTSGGERAPPHRA